MKTVLIVSGCLAVLIYIVLIVMLKVQKVKHAKDTEKLKQDFIKEQESKNVKKEQMETGSNATDFNASISVLQKKKKNK